MKATKLLETQHREVESLFAKLEEGEGDVPALVQELANNLAAHMTIEQEIFYPGVRLLDEDLVDESFEEHAIAELALKRLLATRPDEEIFEARVKALKELIENHVEEEEEELFPTVDDGIEDKESIQLAEQMKKRFEEVLAAGFDTVVPKGGFTKTSADVARAPKQVNGDNRPEGAMQNFAQGRPVPR